MSDGSGQGAGTRTDGPSGSQGSWGGSGKKPSSAPQSTPQSSPKASTAPQAPKASTAPKPSSAPAAPQPADDDTAIRPPLRERIQAKLSTAAEEHRANAAAKAEANAATGTAAPVAKQPSGSDPRPPRRARLRLTRIDPWSVMKTSFLLAIAFGVVTVVAVAMIWSVLDAAGVWDSINTTIQESVGGPDTAALDVENYVGTSRVLGFTMIVAALDVVLITAIATLGAFLYNMSAALLGGIEMTLAEDQN